MGSNVNLASRLENLNKYYGSRILISESVYQNTFMPSMQPHLDFTCRKLGIVATKGMLSGTGVYELIHVYKEDSTVHLCNEFSMCTQLKETKAFDECVMRLQQLHKEFPDDTITERALTEARILQVQKESGEIGEVWSPVLHFNTKF
ncbi:hypothetical protein Pelo_5962 [Pelomyxa schiedti]|nr:hypothetical protein Pelo_5962 [Pelomyxa schiedti]